MQQDVWTFVPVLCKLSIRLFTRTMKINPFIFPCPPFHTQNYFTQLFHRACLRLKPATWSLQIPHLSADTLSLLAKQSSSAVFPPGKCLAGVVIVWWSKIKRTTPTGLLAVFSVTDEFLPHVTGQWDGMRSGRLPPAFLPMRVVFSFSFFSFSSSSPLTCCFSK